MKCSACERNECEQKYEKRHNCVGEKETIYCTCTCQVTEAETFLTSAVSIGIGTAGVAGGVALTFATGMLFYFIM